MMKFLRSQSQTVLVVVLGVIGLGFLFYGSTGNLLTATGQRTNTDYGRIDGDDLTLADLTGAIRNTRNMLMMQGQDQQLSQPGAAAQVANIAWSQLLLLHEADRLHITVSDKELLDLIKSLPMFQKDGVYSPEVYSTRMAELKTRFRLPSDSGMDPTANAAAIFETIVRNNLRSEAAEKALFSGVRSSAHDVAGEYDKYYGPATVSLVTFDPKAFATSAQVTPEEIAAEYKDHPENPDYRSKEERKVDYVLFLLNPEQAKLSDADKTAAKDALGQKALDFALAFQPDPSATGAAATPPDFATEAKKRGLPAATTAFFASDAAPAGVPPSSGFNSAAFALTKDNPISKVVELSDGVAVLHLAEIKPSELRPVDEIKPVITDHLQKFKGETSVQLAAQIDAAQLKAEVAKGKDFKTAAEALKLKVETLPAFIPYKVAGTDQRLQAIAYQSLSLAPGEVSKAVPAGPGGTTVILHLDNRAPADPAGLADFETRFRGARDQELRNQAFADWANWKDKQPGTHKPPELDAYGGVE